MDDRADGGERVAPSDLFALAVGATRIANRKSVSARIFELPMRFAQTKAFRLVSIELIQQQNPHKRNSVVCSTGNGASVEKNALMSTRAKLRNRCYQQIVGVETVRMFFPRSSYRKHPNCSG
ncbi:MAG: hypothetical protein ACREQ4_12335 [Candidatus Binataceae bacterium]